MRKLCWAVIVVLAVLDTGAGSYLWWLLDHKPSRVEYRVEHAGAASSH